MKKSYRTDWNSEIISYQYKYVHNDKYTFIVVGISV